MLCGPWTCQYFMGRLISLPIKYLSACHIITVKYLVILILIGVESVTVRNINFSLGWNKLSPHCHNATALLV